MHDTKPRSSAAIAPDFDVIIVGSGFSGIGTAVSLLREGRRSFVVLEKADEVGGTWRENHYPGCACDVPSHLYSFSFAPNPAWTRMYSPQPEIQQYLRDVADAHGVRPYIRFGQELVAAQFMERDALWRVQTRGGDVLFSRFLVLGVGALHQPALPALEGLGDFAGDVFHSATWNHEVPLAHRRLAVIGTGASAIQFVPQIAPEAQQVHVFQRTPPWILPKRDRAITTFEHRLFRSLPIAQRLHRWAIYWAMELRALGFTVRPRAMRLVRWLAKRHLERQVPDPELRARLTPDYLPGCKRILISNDYLPTFSRPNVELVTEPIVRVTSRGVVTGDGRERPVDVIIFGTGFKVAEVLTQVRVVGRDGLELNEAWRDGIEAYLGTTISRFPNLFVLTGPNTGLGHNSMVFMIEAQIRYMLQCMRAAEARGAAVVDVKPQAQAAYNARLQPRLRNTVWATGCRSWYLDAHGKNSTLWPGFTVEYWLRTARMAAADYTFEPPPTR